MADAPDRERFEARTAAGDLAGFVTYQLTGKIIVYTHTQVLSAYEGQGVGSALARSVMDDAREQGRTVVPMCPFISKWLQTHTEYDDIVARTTRKVK